eukprot:gene12556-biopygen1792
MISGGTTLELRHPKPGSIAAVSSPLRACIGMTLMQINGLQVASYEDVLHATAGSCKLVLRFRHKVSAIQIPKQNAALPRTPLDGQQCREKRAGLQREEAGTLTGDPDTVPPPTNNKLDTVLVKLTRRSFETCIPWGLGLHRHTMVLTDCAKGSLAYDSRELTRCIGMTLSSINGSQVHTTQEASALMECSQSLELCFLPARAARGAPAAPSRSRSDEPRPTPAPAGRGARGTPEGNADRGPPRQARYSVPANEQRREDVPVSILDQLQCLDQFSQSNWLN